MKASPTKESIKMFDELRIINEGKCAALAAQNRTEKDLERMKDALDKLMRCKTREHFASAYIEFYDAIFCSTHNFLYSALNKSFSDIFYFWVIINYKEEDRNEIGASFERIYEYIRKKDAVMAEAAMNMHTHSNSLIFTRTE